MTNNERKHQLSRIIKRDGRVVVFDRRKIVGAIVKSVAETGEFEKKEAERLAGIVVTILHKANGKHIPTVEQAQDVVEQVLMAGGYYETAKAYILYRERRRLVREQEKALGVEDGLNMSVNALKAMASRYLAKDEKGEVIESPRQAIDRVARAVAKVEKRDKKKWEKKFAEMIASFKFVPAGCYFRGAGRKNGLLANCFVLPVEDDMEEIFEAVKWTALIHQAGGGTGYNFSKLRPKGDVVGGGGFASGPISFMRAFDAATAIVMLGGRHRGANMGILNVDHADIFDFITCKTQEGEISNFNISLGASDAFMQAVEKDRLWQLKNPRTGEVVQTVKARTIFDQAVALAWRTGDPGMIYLDEINRNNPVREALGPIEATNVCGEQPLHPFDVCNLGSINLAKFVREGDPSAAVRHAASRRAQDDKDNVMSILSLSTIKKRIDWEGLEETTKLAVRFLDDGIDASEYPILQIKEMAQKVRRIGLGVMGWADMLLKLGVKYDSDEAVRLAKKVMGTVQRAGWEASADLAKEKGEFPLWKESDHAKKHLVFNKKVKVRNVAVTTIAPTGTISMMADCSSGIEPVFALSFVKNVVDEGGLTYTNPLFEKALEEVWGRSKPERIPIILHAVSRQGSLAHVEGVPGWMKQTFRTAHDISPEWHIKMQAAFQQYTDNAVSKTVNFPVSATIDDIRRAYFLAWKKGCKGVTVYRDKSKETQVLASGADGEEGGKRKQIMQSQLRVKTLAQRREENKTNPHEANVCPECGGETTFSEGCVMCHNCGWSACSS